MCSVGYARGWTGSRILKAVTGVGFSVGSGFWGLGVGVWRVRGMGFRDWDWGIEVWGLEFGVWD